MFWKKSGEGSVGRKKRRERVMGVDRRTREEIVNWNHMTALIFQAWGITADIPDFSSG